MTPRSSSTNRPGHSAALLRARMIPMLVIGSLVGAACGSDAADRDDGAAGGEAADAGLDAFCAASISVLDDDRDLSSEPDQAIVELTDLVALAPGEIRDDIEVLVAAFEELDPESPDPLESLLTEETLEASIQLELFTVANCESSPVSAGPLYDLADDGEIPADRASRQGLAAHLDENHADASWYSSIDLVGTLGSTTVQLGGPGLSDAAAEVCAAALDYAAAFPGVEVLVVDSLSGVELVRGTVEDGCTTLDPADAPPEIEDPLYDPFFDDPVEPGVASIDGMRLFLDTEYTDALWRTRVGSTGIGGPRDGPLQMTISVEQASAAEASEVCEALRAYGSGVADSVEVSVSSYERNDVGGVGEETLLVTGTEAGCEPAE